MYETLIEKVYKSTLWIYQIAKLTFLMWLSILIGLIVFGIGPTILTADNIVKDMMMYKGFSVKEYFIKYRKNFVAGNKLILPLILMLMLTIFGFDTFYTTPLSRVYSIFFIYLIQLIFTISTLNTYYQLPIKATFLLIIRFSIYNPINTLILLIVNFLLLNFYYLLPGVIPFFSLGLMQVVNSLLMLNFIKYNESRMECIWHN